MIELTRKEVEELASGRDASAVTMLVNRGIRNLDSIHNPMARQLLAAMDEAAKSSDQHITAVVVSLRELICLKDYIDRSGIVTPGLHADDGAWQRARTALAHYEQAQQGQEGGAA